MAFEIKPQPGPQTQALKSACDIVIFGGGAGGGKSFQLLLETLYHKNNPGFGAVIFRRTYPEIMNEGGLWDTSENIYPFAGAVPRQSDCQWVFPSGASVKFAHMQHEKDKLSWQGSGIPLIGFDELTHFSEGQFFYLLSRNRLSNNCGIRPYIRATCNPDPDSWVARFIEWWIDQDTGLPIKERAGVPRYFIRENGKIIWGATPQDFTLAPGQEAKSVTFIPALVTDNKALLKNDPAYLSNLHALPFVERERLLNGNWKVRPVSGSFFRRSWFKVITPDECPIKGRIVRYWDRAATEVSSGAKDPDWTAGVRTITPDNPINGITPIIITDVKRARLSPAGVMALVRREVEQDPECEQWLEEDPGQAGKSEVDMYRRELPDANIRTLRPKGSKAFRAKPASALAEQGKIWIVLGPWNEAFLSECESFADWDVIEKSERPSKLPHDDQVDGLSGSVYVQNRGGNVVLTRA